MGEGEAGGRGSHRRRGDSKLGPGLCRVGRQVYLEVGARTALEAQTDREVCFCSWRRGKVVAVVVGGGWWWWWWYTNSNR